MIPARYAPIVFGALLSAIMVALVSAFVIGITQGIDANFLARWLKSPTAVKPGSLMPDQKLSDPEVAALVAYLQSLR